MVIFMYGNATSGGRYEMVSHKLDQRTNDIQSFWSILISNATTSSSVVSIVTRRYYKRPKLHTLLLGRWKVLSSGDGECRYKALGAPESVCAAGNH